MDIDVYLYICVYIDIDVYLYICVYANSSQVPVCRFCLLCLWFGCSVLPLPCALPGW